MKMDFSLDPILESIAAITVSKVAARISSMAAFICATRFLFRISAQKDHMILCQSIPCFRNDSTVRISPLSSFERVFPLHTAMSPSATIAIAGMTGRFANMMVKHLLAKPNVYINGIARNPGKVPADVRRNERVKLFTAESNDVASIREALRGATVCVCCYLGDNTFMVEGQKVLIDACIAEKVPRYVAGDWCLDYRGLEMGDHPIKDPMKIIHQYLDEKEKETDGAIRAVHILNGVFLEIWWTTALTGIYDPRGPTFSCWGTLDETWEGITYDDAAKFTAEVAVDESATGFLNGELPERTTLFYI